VVVLVVVLVVTNLASVGALLYFRYGPQRHPRPDGQVAAAIDRATPRGAAGATRRVITVEILNPIELAATRGRLVGMAGSLAPGLTRRLVYDQAVRTLKRQLVEEHVVADVRVHTVRPDPAGKPVGPPGPVGAQPLPDVLDESVAVDLSKPGPAADADPHGR
jgi:hypothetical protein